MLRENLFSRNDIVKNNILTMFCNYLAFSWHYGRDLHVIEQFYYFNIINLLPPNSSLIFYFFWQGVQIFRQLGKTGMHSIATLAQ